MELAQVQLENIYFGCNCKEGCRPGQIERQKRGPSRKSTLISQTNKWTPLQIALHRLNHLLTSEEVEIYPPPHLIYTHEVYSKAWSGMVVISFSVCPLWRCRIKRVRCRFSHRRSVAGYPKEIAIQYIQPFLRDAEQTQTNISWILVRWLSGENLFYWSYAVKLIVFE